MNVPTWQKRNRAALESASPSQLDQHTLAKYGRSFADVDRICAIGAKLTRGESISASDAKVLKAIYSDVDPRLIQRSVDDVNALPVPLRIQGFAHHLTGDSNLDSPIVKEVRALVEDYATNDLSIAVQEKRAQAAPRDMNGRVIPDTPKPKHDPLAIRSLLEREIKKPERQAAAALTQDPELAREVLASRAESAVQRLELADALSPRDAVEAAFDYHAAEAIAEDQGLIEGADNG